MGSTSKCLWGQEGQKLDCQPQNGRRESGKTLISCMGTRRADPGVRVNDSHKWPSQVCSPVLNHFQSRNWIKIILDYEHKKHDWSKCESPLKKENTIPGLKLIPNNFKYTQYSTRKKKTTKHQANLQMRQEHKPLDKIKSKSRPRYCNLPNKALGNTVKTQFRENCIT